MDKMQAERKAREIIRLVVTMLSQRQYKKIETAAEMEELTCDDVREDEERILARLLDLHVL